MKNTLIVMALLGLTVTTAVKAADVCPAIEFAELQTYSEEELKNLSKRYSNQALLMATRGYSDQYENCAMQRDRVDKIKWAKFFAQFDKKVPPKVASEPTK